MSVEELLRANKLLDGISAEDSEGAFKDQTLDFIDKIRNGEIKPPIFLIRGFISEICLVLDRRRNVDVEA